ncbi:MAG: hypothetical protein KDI19_11765, partial [Pseudomonadales bacterium]|nr:hypothetical protein [Pseudomonadales bacterium]
ASWIAARSVAAGHPDIEALELPVTWGSPGQYLGEICRNRCPAAIVSMGEGREGWFDIETFARRERKERIDNLGRLPEGEPIDPVGPTCVSASIDARAIQRPLVGEGYPVRISSDAGAFLCEETLYTLERLRGRHETLRTVIFVHLPPHGTTVRVNGQEMACDEALLSRFAESLIRAVRAVHTSMDVAGQKSA